MPSMYLLQNKVTKINRLCFKRLFNCLFNILLSKIENLFGSIDLFGDEDDDNVMEYENEETEDDEDEEISDELSLSLLSRAFGKRNNSLKRKRSEEDLANFQRKVAAKLDGKILNCLLRCRLIKYLFT